MVERFYDGDMVRYEDWENLRDECSALRTKLAQADSRNARLSEEAEGLRPDAYRWRDFRHFADGGSVKFHFGWLNVDEPDAEWNYAIDQLRAGKV